MTNVPIVPDFSRPHVEAPTPIQFTIDDFTYSAYPEAGGGLILDALGLDEIEKINNLPTDEAGMAALSPAESVAMAKAVQHQTEKLIHFLDLALLPESAAEFADRLKRMGPGSISLPQALTVARWLAGQYANRPTVPPSSSPNGHGGTGTPSTDGAQPAT